MVLVVRSGGGRLRLGKEVPQGLRGVCQLVVVLSEYLLQRLGEGRVIG